MLFSTEFPIKPEVTGQMVFTKIPGVFAKGLSVLMAALMLLIFPADPAVRQAIDSSGLFGNTAETALPQTVVADMVREHFHGALPAGKTVKKCFVIGLDGARCDSLIQLKDETESGINRLAAQGGLVVAIAGGDSPLHLQATKTAPGWTTILTGKWANSHLVYYNGMIKLLTPKTFLTELVEQGSAGSAAFYTWWPWHVQKAYSTYRVEAAYAKLRGLPVTWNTCAGEEAMQEALLAEAAKPDCADILFSIYDRPDEAGHAYGYGVDVPEYAEAVRQCDLDAYDIIKTIEARETYETEDWLILMTTDHGGQGKDHGDLSDGCRLVFIASNKEIAPHG